MATLIKQSILYMAELRSPESQRRNPIRAASLRRYDSLLDTWIRGGKLKLNVDVADVSNATLRQLVNDMQRINPKISASTVTAVVKLTYAIVRSVVDPKTLFPVHNWPLNADGIGLPRVRKKAQPRFGAEQVEAIIAASRPEDGLLATILAATGLRVSEALAIHVEGGTNSDFTHLDLEAGVLRVRSARPRNLARDHDAGLKTTAAARELILPDELCAYIEHYLGDHAIAATGLLFAKPEISYRKRLNDILEKLEICGSFHSFRRFRADVIHAANPPSFLIKNLMGHADSDLSSGTYANIQGSALEPLRREWAARISLGFSLPSVATPAVDRELVGAACE